MNQVALRAYVHVRSVVIAWRSWANEKGEGVISAAIAVLIMAFLGAGMWLAFNAIFKSTAKNTCEQTKVIGGADNSTDCSSVGND